jgi:glycosyltransferase involved in cell wall biosynthesis
MMEISIIIPTLNRKECLERCLDSILIQKSSIVKEILVIINGVDLAAKTLLESKYCKVPSIKYFQVKQMTPGQARNYATKHATSSFIHFIDDDTKLPTFYYRNLENFIHLHPQALIIGGPDQAPKDSNYWQYSFGLALESQFCTGSTSFRHKKYSKNIQPANERHLTLANLIINKEFINKNNLYFKSKYFRNEENELLLEASKLTEEIHWSSELYLYHYRRENIIHSLKAIFNSGYFRGKLIKEKGLENQKLFCFFPLILIISQIILFLFFARLALVFVVIYALIALVPTILIVIRKKAFAAFPSIWILHYFIPMTYSFGMLKIFLNPHSDK